MQVNRCGACGMQMQEPCDCNHSNSDVGCPGCCCMADEVFEDGTPVDPVGYRLKLGLDKTKSVC